MKLMELFARQLEYPECTPSTGDFLNGRHPLEVIQEWERLPLKLHRAELVQQLAIKIREYRQHAGERELFFMEVDPYDHEGPGQLMQVWENDVERLLDTHVIVVPPFVGSSGIPRLALKV